MPSAATLDAMRTAALLLALASSLIAVSRARADGPGDGLYGRFDSDFTLAVGVGGGATWRQEPDAGHAVHGTAVADARLLVLDAAGPFLSARWGPHAGAYVLAGVELRPLFPALFLLNLSTGHEWVDLFVQSLSVELGAAMLPLSGDLGVGLAVGLGVEVPLLVPTRFAQGLSLRIGARRITAGPGDRNGPDRRASEWSLLTSLVIKTSVGSTTASREPRRYRPR